MHGQTLIQCRVANELSAADRAEIDRVANHAGIQGMHATTGLVNAICSGYRFDVHWITAARNDQMLATLPLVFQKTFLFGRYLVSLPYLNWGGIAVDDSAGLENGEAAKIRISLVDRAIELAEQLKVKFLELRHEQPVEHERLSSKGANKCQMRMSIAEGTEHAFARCRSTVRTQVRKGDKQEFVLDFGGAELIEDYYRVFATNMRDLGTPVFSKQLFIQFAEQMGDRAELCVVKKSQQPIACALVFHHPACGNIGGLTEVPSASALRSARKTAVNTWMYWQIIQRAIERGSQTFDFGRSTPQESTYDFKRKWGAEPSPIGWQRFSSDESVDEVRPDNPKYSKAIETWQKLPLGLANLLGPSIVRGIP
ncbi:MAG: FemAB family XrtA/PEP-CTERM system-associated protein [Planctomycetota bacterium]